MSEFNGIFLRNEQNQLLFLTLPKLKQVGVIPAAQSFETSLMMIALGRWTTAVVLIANALEIVVKSTIESDNSRDLSEITREFVKLKRVSSSVQARADRSRRLRNTYIHEATIPEDNAEAITSYLRDGLPAFENFFERAFGVRILSSLNDVYLSRNLHFAKTISDQFSDKPGYYVSVLVKTISNLFHAMLTPEAMFYAPNKDRSWDAWEEFMEARRLIEESIGDCDIHHDLVSCPAACEGHLSVAIETYLTKEELRSGPG